MLSPAHSPLLHLSDPFSPCSTLSLSHSVSLSLSPAPKKRGLGLFGASLPPPGVRTILATVGGGGGLACAFKPSHGLRQGPPCGMVLLMVADVLRLSQVIHAGLATRDPACDPPLWGLGLPLVLETVQMVGGPNWRGLKRGGKAPPSGHNGAVPGRQ